MGCRGRRRATPTKSIMGTYITRRLIQGIVVILVASMFCFIIFQFTGDPVVNMVGQYATFEEAEEVRQLLGLDKPLYVQYGRFIWNAASRQFW